MNANYMINNYLNQFSEKEKNELLFSNDLKFLLNYAVDDKEKFSMKISFATMQMSLRKIIQLFEESHINYITFKGIVLGSLLYDEPYRRQCGDIDIFVDKEDYNRALQALSEIGYKFVYKKENEDLHHLILTNNIVTVELHKRILNPKIGIVDETYLYKHTIKRNIFNCEMSTFDTTATLLHLLYHLYMDRCCKYSSFLNVVSRLDYPQIPRFLFRAYEISLFIEKYNNEIKWKDIETNIKLQKLNIYFKEVIYDILKVFPDILPPNFIKTIEHNEYLDPHTDKLHSSLMNLYINNRKKDLKKLLCEFIDKKWDENKKCNICKILGESFTIQKYNEDLKCNVFIEENEYGIRFTFRVSDIDFCFSKKNQYDTHKTDGIHLILCSTHNYSYNSVFLFPKIINGRCVVVAYDTINETVLDDSLITTKLKLLDNEYEIISDFTNKFIKMNNINSYFYLGLVISNCSKKTQGRTNSLILTDDASQWYNPIFFAKILF